MLSIFRSWLKVGQDCWSVQPNIVFISFMKNVNTCWCWFNGNCKLCLSINLVHIVIIGNILPKVSHYFPRYWFPSPALFLKEIVTVKCILNGELASWSRGNLLWSNYKISHHQHEILPLRFGTCTVGFVASTVQYNMIQLYLRNIQQMTTFYCVYRFSECLLRNASLTTVISSVKVNLCVLV